MVINGSSDCIVPAPSPYHLYVDVTKLSTHAADTVQQVPSISPVCCPIEINIVVFRRRVRKYVHPLFRVLHLPDPPYSVNHAMMEPE